MPQSIIIEVAEGTNLEALHGKVFQIFKVPATDKIRLYEVTVSTRCPVIVGGEQCGKEIGHVGCHRWAGGD